MAEKIKSAFGPYASKMQVMIDKTKEIFAPLWFPKFFDWGNTTVDLNFQTVIGRSRIEAAAKVVDRESPTPLGSRANIEKLSGSVPAIKQGFKMNEEDYRAMLTIQNMNNISDQVKKTQLLDLLFGDVKKAGNAPLKSVDIMCLQAVSTGKVSINSTTNPSGLALGDIDLLMPATNKKSVVEKWSVASTTPANVKPLTDIKNVVKAAKAKGIRFEKMLMRIEAFWYMQKSTEVLDELKVYYNPGSNAKVGASLDRVNEMLAAYKMPIIEIVDATVGIEKDGAISTLEPFNEYAVSFIPSGKLGIIHNAYTIEQLKPVKNVDYANFGKVHISKWAQNNPWGEFTQGELNAFPGLEAIDHIFILDTNTKA